LSDFWKYLAIEPATLKRTWASVNEVMAHAKIEDGRATGKVVVEVVIG
jgi:hypothetical protein